MIMHLVKDRELDHTAYCGQSTRTHEFLGLGWWANYRERCEHLYDMCQGCTGAIPDLDFLEAVDWEDAL